MNAAGEPLIEGNLAIDLMNTEEIRRGVRRDFIGSADEFSVWLSDEELVGAISKVQIPFEVEVWPSENLEKVRELRSEVREYLGQVAEGRGIETEFVQQLESFVERAPFILKLHNGRVVRIPMGDPIERLCSLVAMYVLELIGTDQFRHLRRCENPNCLFMFIDESGRRKWCSMKVCGNRAKVTKHLRRQEQNHKQE